MLKSLGADRKPPQTASRTAKSRLMLPAPGVMERADGSNYIGHLTGIT